MATLLYNSDRNDPGSKRYFQKTADLIAIFWLFHKELLRTGQAEFSYSFDEYTHMEPFSPSAEIKEERSHGGNDPIDIVRKYSIGVERSIERSWGIFLREMGFNVRPFAIGDKTSFVFPKSAKIFISEYTKHLINDVQELGKIYSTGGMGQDFKVENTIALGIETGSEVTGQLDAIIGDEMKPVFVLLISKIRGKYNRPAQREIGIPDLHVGDLYNYDLLHPVDGIDRQRLRQYDFGTAIGCPASIKISPQTKKFLQETHGITFEGTMLGDFATMFHDKFREVRLWYKKLNDGDKLKLVTKENRNILDGKVWDTIKDTNDSPQSRCPYSKERF